MNLYRQVNKWFTDVVSGYKPFLNIWLYFNATPYVVGTVTMNMVSGDRIVKEYITGTKVKQLTLAMDFVTAYDLQGTSDLNMDTIDELENFCRWVEEKNKSKEFPDFGTNNIIENIKVLSNVPTMLVDTTQGLAKYQIQIQINYNEMEVI